MKTLFKKGISKFVIEYSIYAIIWILLFLGQIIEEVQYPLNDDFIDALKSLVFILPFFIFFIIHDFSLSYFELKKNKRWLYLTITTFATAALIFHFLLISPKKDFKSKSDFNKTELLDLKHFEDHPFQMDQPRPDFPKPHRHFSPFHLIPPLTNLLIALMIIVFNRGLKLQFRYFENQKRVMDLENQNIQNELNYLKHQINPHFFMNTLNNIHALVRSNPEKAEDAIVGFSKIMRYLLYESNLEKVSLEKEFILIRNYTELMRLLLTDHVKINLELPWIFPSVSIPPLIYITFLENAFKHGISYSKDSFIYLKITYDELYIYSVIQNSNHHVKSESGSGIGLENVKKRLGLIYGNRFKMKINETTEDFKVELQIPITE
jgi:hypothetical protein